ncbi:MAG: cytochrome c oxidase subunit 3 [Gemmatimonadota bacterium]
MTGPSMHAPEPSPWPIATAAGILLAAGGILLHPGVAAAGAAGTVVSVVGWSRERRRDAEGASAAPRGMLLFLLSEGFFFGSLIAAYLYLRIRNGAWPPEGFARLPAGFAGLNTVVLLASGVTMHLAARALGKGRLGAFRVLLAATAALGCAFLAGQAYEYRHVGFGIADGLMGSTFFTLTGFHGAHVAGGILLLLLVLARTLRGAETPGGRGLVESAAYYWHFVDAVWVALFAALYLL